MTNACILGTIISETHAFQANLVNLHRFIERNPT
jgi:hypothetical protein